MEIERVPPVPVTYLVTLTATELRALRAIAGYAGYVERQLKELYNTRKDVDTSNVRTTLLAFWTASHKLVDNKEL
jgi:hypothetical protein